MKGVKFNLLVIFVLGNNVWDITVAQKKKKVHYFYSSFNLKHSGSKTGPFRAMILEVMINITLKGWSCPITPEVGEKVMHGSMAYLCNQYAYIMQFLKYRGTWEIIRLTVLVICLSLSSKSLLSPFYSLFCDAGAGTLYAAFPISFLAIFVSGSASERHWWESGSWEEGRKGPFPASVLVNFTVPAAKSNYDSSFQLFPPIPGLVYKASPPSLEYHPIAVYSYGAAHTPPPCHAILVSGGPQLP